MDILREKARALGAHRALCSDAPDTSGMNRAAELSAELGQDALEWYQQAYAEQAPLRERAANTAEEVSRAQLASMRNQDRLAERADNYRRSVFEPLEREIVNDAQQFDTEAERERLAGIALGDVNQQFDAARDSAVRAQTRMGVNPADGAAASLNKDLALGKALAGVQAKNQTRQQAMTLGRALKMDAAALGRGLASQQATNASLALNAGNSAAGTAQMPVQMSQSATQMGGQGFDAAMRGQQISGNLYGQAAQLQANSGGSDWMGGLANLGMAGAKLWSLSDKNEKTGRKRVKGKVALEAARRMPVDAWKYRKGGAGDDGGRTHVGPMAQDVRAALGDEAAPGGKVVDLTSLAGTALAAVQEVDKRQRKLEKKVMSLAHAKRTNNRRSA
jgi:hypothetical protein